MLLTEPGRKTAAEILGANIFIPLQVSNEMLTQICYPEESRMESQVLVTWSC